MNSLLPFFAKATFALCGLSLASERALTTINSKITKARFLVFLLIAKIGASNTNIKKCANQPPVNDKYVWGRKQNEKKKKNQWRTTWNNVGKTTDEQILHWVLGVECM